MKINRLEFLTKCPLHPGRSDRIGSRSKSKKNHLLPDSGLFQDDTVKVPAVAYTSKWMIFWSDSCKLGTLWNYLLLLVWLWLLRLSESPPCFAFLVALALPLCVQLLHCIPPSFDSPFLSFLLLPPPLSRTPQKPLNSDQIVTECARLYCSCDTLPTDPKLSAMLEGNVVAHTLNRCVHCSVCETYQIRFSNESLYCVCVCICDYIISILGLHARQHVSSYCCRISFTPNVSNPNKNTIMTCCQAQFCWKKKVSAQYFIALHL